MKSRAKKYTPEFREKTVKLALITDIKSASAFYQLNRKTVGKWVNLYRKEGDASYGYRKKRNDKQKKKISNIVLKRIIKFKKDNPKVTLENIKQEFCLDCSLTTIAKKLKKYSRNKTGTNEQVLTISYNILKHSRFKGEIKKIYQFNMFDSLTKNQYIGFSTERNIKNFCIFIYYVISQLKKLEYLSNNVKIVTSLKYLEQLNEHKSEYGKTIFTNFKIPIVIEKNTSLNNLNVNKISSSFSKEELMVSAYETTIMCNGNTILIHPINIDAHLADSNKIDYLCVSPSFSSELLSLSLEKIEYYGDQARAKYDLDKAKLLYGKIYLTTLQYTCSKGKTLKIKSLYKRAIIFYHTDDYKTAKELLLQVLNLSKNCQNSFQIGYIYYHLGMIHMIENNQKLSEDNLSFAINEFLQSPQKKFLLDYFKANVKKYAYMGHFDTALRYAHKYVKSAKYQKNEKQVCEAYDTRGKVYFRKAKYKYAEKDYLRQMEIAHKSSLYETEVKAINNLLSVYTYNLSKSIEDVKKLVERIDFLSKKIKKEFYLHLCYHLVGNFYYYQQKYRNAISFYEKVDTYLKKINDQFNLVRNSHNLGYCYYKLMDNIKALQYFKIVCKSTKKQDIHYISHSYNCMGRIYLNANKKDLCLDSLKKSVKHAKIINNNILIADGLKCIGMLFGNFKPRKAVNYFKRSLTVYNKIYRVEPSTNHKENIEFIKDNIQVLRVAKS